MLGSRCERGLRQHKWGQRALLVPPGAIFNCALRGGSQHDKRESDEPSERADLLLGAAMDMTSCMRCIWPV